MKQTIRDLAESLNLDVETAEQEDVKKAQQGLMSELQSLIPQQGQLQQTATQEAQPSNPLQ